MSSENDTPTLRDYFQLQFDSIKLNFGTMDHKQDLMITKQDLTNGRLRNAEKAIAVLKVFATIGAFIAATMFKYLLDRLP